MQRRQAYKFELRANGSQEKAMRRFAGACRYVYNRALAVQQELHNGGEKKVSFPNLCGNLPLWKKESKTKWLSEAPAQALQQSIKDLEWAYINFFQKRAEHPRFKKRGQRESFRIVQDTKLDQEHGRIRLPKLGWMRYRNSRKVEGKIKNVTISQNCGKWFVSIQTEREVDKAVPQSTASVGIDMGIARFATLSDGSFIKPVNSFRKNEKRLARYQRAMERKVRFSNNWKKAKSRVQKLKARISNTRSDFLHQATNTISKNHALVFVENLHISNLSRSASGTMDNPGRNVASKSGLNKAIRDQGWFKFRRQLEYKLEWRGGQLIAVPPQYTSQRCPHCGHVSKENRQSQAKFLCVSCTYEAHADLVGALNVRAAGHAVLACGEVVQSGASVKQEPTEEAKHVIA